MEPSKPKKKADAREASTTASTTAATTSATTAEPKRKRRASKLPMPVEAELDGDADVHADANVDAEFERARDRAIVDRPERADERAERADEHVRIDPLQEFLAIYDDGDLAHVVDFGAVSPDLDDEKRFLSFDLAGEAYAASIMDIREILKFVALTEVPRAPREVLGVLSKRGIVMPVVDLGAILGLRAPERRVERDQRVLVAGEGERVCGLRVDRVHEVVRLTQRGIEDVPASLGTKNAHMLIGLGRSPSSAGGPSRILILLDVPAVLAHFSEAMGIAPAPTREAS